MYLYSESSKTHMYIYTENKPIPVPINLCRGKMLQRDSYGI